MRRVNQSALDGRIPGAGRLGRSWAVPEDTVKPEKHTFGPEPKEMSGKNSGKDILEVGCGSGYSASLIVKDHPKSYTGMDIMPEQLEKAEALKSGFTAVKRCNYAGLDFCFKFEKAKG